MIREYKDYVADIIDSIDKTESFVKGMKLETFEKDIKTVYAVIRAFEIMGEAVKKIPSRSATNIKTSHGKKWPG